MDIRAGSDFELPKPGPVMAPVGNPFPRRMYPKSASFKYVNVGGMVSMGFGDGIVDLGKADVPKKVAQRSLRGFLAMVAWRGGYLTKQLSWRNLFIIPVQWTKSIIFGRDISRF